MKLLIYVLKLLIALIENVILSGKVHLVSGFSGRNIYHVYFSYLTLL